MPLRVAGLNKKPSAATRADVAAPDMLQIRIGMITAW
jgi:hypothetical protein